MARSAIKMDKETLKKAVISIIIGASITMLSTILTGLLELLQKYQGDIVPMATGMIYFIKSWKTSQIG